jgi:hypothetical protein
METWKEALSPRADHIIRLPALTEDTLQSREAPDSPRMTITEGSLSNKSGKSSVMSVLSRADQRYRSSGDSQSQT